MTTKDEDVVVVGDKAKPPPPPVVWMRWSKVLNKFVPCIESDRDAIAYQILK